MKKRLELRRKNKGKKKLKIERKKERLKDSYKKEENGETKRIERGEKKENIEKRDGRKRLLCPIDLFFQKNNRPTSRKGAHIDYIAL